jgi:hypothetical protein
MVLQRLRERRKERREGDANVFGAEDEGMAEIRGG